MKIILVYKNVCNVILLYMKEYINENVGMCEDKYMQYDQKYFDFLMILYISFKYNYN